MTRDTTAPWHEYAKGFAGGGQSRLGKAGMTCRVGADGLAGPSAEEPVSFDRYCDISGAMSAWSKQARTQRGLHSPSP